MEESISKSIDNISLINDLICDNITLKNELEKLHSQTNSLNQKFEHMDTRIKAMSDGCDVVFVDIVKDNKHIKTRKISDGKQPTKAFLCS